MKDEVEEFLRRAAARRAQAEAKRRAEQRQTERGLPPRPAPLTRQPVRSIEPVEDVIEIIDAEDAETPSRYASNMGQRWGSTSEIARHAENLGADVDQADDRLEARLHRTFDHKIGQLKDTTTSVAPAAIRQTIDPSSTLGQIVRLLSNPQSIPTAIVLGEILNRPEDRWK
jgi:hypothetical protein